MILAKAERSDTGPPLMARITYRSPSVDAKAAETAPINIPAVSSGLAGRGRGSWLRPATAPRSRELGRRRAYSGSARCRRINPDCHGVSPLDVVRDSRIDDFERAFSGRIITRRLGAVFGDAPVICAARYVISFLCHGITLLVRNWSKRRRLRIASVYVQA